MTADLGVCRFHRDELAEHSIMTEGGGTVYVCTPCKDRIMEGPTKKYVCKFCHVPIISKTNKKPVLGRQHGRHCPRRFR